MSGAGKAIAGHSRASTQHTRWDKVKTNARIGNIAKFVDDACLHDETIGKNFWSTCKYILVYAQNGIVFNPEKFAFARKEMYFAGFIVTMDGYKPTKNLLEAIKNPNNHKNKSSTYIL